MLGLERLSDDERRSLRSVALGRPLASAAAWLHSQRVTNGVETGWPHLAGGGSPSEWGGTVDALRALIVAGASPSEPALASSLAWLVSRQRSDGGFGSREMGYSAAEPTAWVAILLHEAGAEPSQPVVVRALDFLESCIDSQGAVATSPNDLAAGDTSRRYPALLACWALGLWQRVSGEAVARKLKADVDRHSGLWAVRGGAAHSVATSAAIVVALIRGGYAGASDELVRRAARSILDAQLPDGRWAASSETWFSCEPAARTTFCVRSRRRPGR